ncbi:hypothetical protein GMRT_25322 [Giardia muris]|uniref:Uncharacterized protein n=1 Tax=Giardia muris TaxID=5742 RepID=A0A4Z1SZM8_GIAMU|nr:hypothetical protein GMRT_25322 [Giardia muris]|eukprot:TNJ26107.1 hypothetical protein GMRT_25322 [Giardia muris]
MRSGRGRRWPDCTVWPHRLLPPLRGERGRSGLPPGPLPCSQHATTTPRSSSPPPTSEEWRTPGGTGMVVWGQEAPQEGQTHPLQGATDVLGVRHNWGRRGSQEHYTWASRLMGCSPDDGRLSRTPPSVRLLLPLEGGCSTTGRRRPCCLHSRRAGSSARLLADEAAVHEGTEECTSRGSEGLFGSGLTHSSRTYRAVADALEEAVMRKVRERLEMLNPHHVLALLSQSSSRRPGSSERWSGRHSSASPEHWTTPSVRTKWLTGASSASHARRTRSSFPAGTSSSVRTGSSTAVRTAGEGRRGPCRRVS